MTRETLFKQASQIGKWFLPAAALLYVVSLFFPWVYGPPTAVDDSWKMALHAAVVQHWQSAVCQK
jgi:hypothetical protein